MEDGNEIQENKTQDDDSDDYEQEACIIDDTRTTSPRTTDIDYISRKDYEEWVVNKIMSKIDFYSLIADAGKKFNENTLFWKFIKKHCNEKYQQIVQVATNKVYKLIKQYPKLVENLSFDQISAIYCYQLDIFYAQLNQSLRSNSDKWSDFCGPLSAALYKLPFCDFEKNTVYLALKLKEQKYTKGCIIRWSGFTSTTLDIQVAKQHVGSDGVIYEIESGYHGKDISKFCAIPDEKEVIFNLSSHFLITDTRIEDKIYYVKLKELPFPWQGKNSKTLLWVDDNPGNNKKIMEQCERNGIMVIPRVSTQGALEFFDFMYYAFQRDA
eukprot:402478_1